MGVEGKVVVVTGASRGIGAAIATRLARNGARVVAGARNVDRLREVEARAREEGKELLATPMDVRRQSEVEAAIALAVGRFGGLDAIVNNAALGALGRIEDQGEREWEDVLHTNVIGTMLCCQAAIPHLARRGGGTIVNISSAAANDGFPLLGVYSGSKAAIVALSQSLRREVKDRKIRVSTVRIHHVMSEFLSAHSTEAVSEATQLWLREGLLAMTPLISPGHVAEVVELLIALPPDASVHDVDVRATGA